MQTKLAAVVVGLFLLPAQAQLPTAREEIQVTLVEVPVNVVDRNGEPVRGLTTANFELFDNGQRRAITHFDVIDLAGGAPKKESAGLSGAAAARNFLLLFDLSNSAPGTLTRAREAARTFVSGAALEGDRIAVATFTAETGVHMTTSFTTDRKLVSAAIATLGAPKYFQPVDPLLLSAIEMHEAADLAEASSRPNDQYVAEVARMQARMLDRSANDVQMQFIRRTLDGYADLAHVLDRVPGRKQVILLTEGFDAKLLHGRESIAGEQARDEQRMIEAGEVWRVDNDNRYGNAQTAGELRGMIEMCRRADVVLHAIDVRGIRVSGAEVRDVGAKSNESLFLLTHDTGGMVFKNANSLDEDFRRLLRSQEVVYILGFQAPSRAAGKFHELRVKLVNAPSARALHRAGYFESSPALTPVERTLTAAEIITHQIPVSDVGVRTLATPFPRRDGRAQVPVIVEIDGPSVMRAAKGNQIQSELFIYAFDEKDTIRDFVHQPIGLDVVKLRDRLQRGVRVYETLMLAPGRYSVRTLVRAGNQPLHGYNSTVIDVPSYEQAAVLGGFAVDDKPGEWVPVKPPERQGVPHEYPFLIDGAMLVPAAAPVFRSGVTARFGLYVGNLPAKTLNVAAAVNGRETPVRIAARSTGPDGTAKLLIDFVPPPLPPGEYELTLRVPDLESTGRNVAVVSFAIQ
ncbi:MAG TPA: VWA domain-containing protein [Thermoanaerobaculia bacterium]